MDIDNNSNNILSVLDNFTLDDPDEIAMLVAKNFRKRRVEKNITRHRMAELSEYDKSWLAHGFNISPLELPLKPGVFVAKPQPFYGNFGVFEDSLPDGYGRYLLYKALLRNDINDLDLSSLDRLALIGDNGMGALTYSPSIYLEHEETVTVFDRLQEIALEVFKEQQDKDAGLLLYNSGNSGGARPKAVFSDAEGHWIVKFRHTYDPKDIGIQEARYNEVAQKCGIIVPDFRLVNGQYFASRRFDIDNKGNAVETSSKSKGKKVSFHTPSASVK